MVKKGSFSLPLPLVILAAATVPVGSTAAMACHGCWKAAQARHLATMKERKAFREECRAHRRATYKKG